MAQRFAELIERGHASILVADVGGRVVGWIHVAVTPLLEMDLGAEILGLVVDRDHVAPVSAPRCSRRGITGTSWDAAQMWLDL